MKHLVSVAKPAAIKSDCLICAVHVDGNGGSYSMPAATAAVDAATGGGISALLKVGDVPSSLGGTLLCHDLPGIKSRRLLLVNCGPAEKLDLYAYSRAVQAAVGKLQQLRSPGGIVNLLPQLQVPKCPLHARIRHAVLDAGDMMYSFDGFRSDNGGNASTEPESMTFVVAEAGRVAAKKGIREGLALVAGTTLTKNLGNTPPNVCTPSYLERQARELCKSSGKLSLQVLGEGEMKKLGMGSLLAVSAGSRQPPKLIIMKYEGARSGKQPPVLLVGKGVTFDTGGISLKPSANMDEMKFDMCGAASVFGVLRAILELALPINVVGIVPAVENMPGGAAARPGDIVTSMSGQTIEILNTDAEGRLILCDALSYGLRFKPAAVVDIATLTGACVVALGHHASGLIGNDNKLVQALLRAGDSSGDRVWQLPLWPDYDRQLTSTFADMANISSGRDAGTITAACFLSRFTKSVPWAHLDIAGTAWTSGKYKKATGRPVPLLVQYLLHLCDA